MAQSLPADLALAWGRVRQETLQLFDLAQEQDLHASPGFGYRPLIWHLAHIGVYEAYWILQQLWGQPAPDEHYQVVFDPIHTPRAESKNLPSRAGMESYLAGVRERVLRCLETPPPDADNPLWHNGYVFDLVREHEQQHQETLAYLFHLLAPEKKTRPATLPLPAAVPTSGAMAEIPAGAFRLGAGGDAFAYDNEYPAHEVVLPAFRLDVNLTTNAEYADFIEDGGYYRHEFWDDEGWHWRTNEDWIAPLHWRMNAGGWREVTMFEEVTLRYKHPVSGVSWYEAEAYAKWRGKRLPTEAEWEKAAVWDETTGRQRRYVWGDDAPDALCCNYDTKFWSSTPVGAFPDGASLYGCLDMTGNVWEWTATPFDAYPGFAPFPYPEYSQLWFDGDHRVLRGGSWATRPGVLRATFRNFFRRHFRIAFAGIRCAE